MIAQPKGAAPVSKEVVEVVKRKMAAPARPPPAGMTLNFNAPKNISSGAKDSSNRYDEYDNPYDDENNNEENDDEDNDGDDEDDYYSEDSQGMNHRCDYEDIYREDEGSPQRADSVRRSSKYTEDTSDISRSRDSRSDRRLDQSIATDPAPMNSVSLLAQSKQGGATKIPPDAKDQLSSSGSGDKPSQRPQETKGSAPSDVPVGSPAEVVTHYLKAARLSSLKFNYMPILKATYRELKSFATSPCSPGMTTLCYIERNRSGTKRLAPYYSVCADLEDGTGRQLMVCRKVMRSRSPHYVFSLKAEDLWRKREQRSRLYLGKLRATSSNSYVLYDNGICEAPEESDSFFEARELGVSACSQEKDSSAQTRKAEREKKPGASSDDMSLYRSELMVLHFNTKSRPTPAGKRGTEVCVPCNFSADPKAKQSNAYCIEGPFNKVRAEMKQNSMYSQSCFFVHEKTSRYDPLSSCLVDFKGRANMASIKNVQFVVSEPLCEVANKSPDAQMKIDGDKDFVLQLGKTTEDCFNMDFRYPLSLLQAFAICVARFDAKLTW